MAEYELDRLLVQIRRIEEHREKGAEKEIRKTYQSLLKELRHYLADTYSQYAEDDRLDYGILQQHSAYARFLEEVEQKINDISPEVKRLIRGTVDQTYEYTYNGMIDCVQRAAKDVAAVKGLKGCTPDVIRRAVENPVSKLTLNDRLEKHRKEIVYDIKQNISVGLMNGDRYSTMANRVKQSVEGDYKKAIRIARTETHRVREAGNHDAAVSVNEALKNSTAGVQMMKTWRTMKDERVRPAKAKGKAKKYDHRKMDGIEAPVDEEFTLPSGAETLAPGQSGVAGEDINCRCYLSYGIKEIAVDNARENDYNKDRRSIVNSKDFSELEQYTQSVYGISTDKTVKSLDFESVKQSLIGIESVISEFPEVGTAINRIVTSKSGVMSCTGAEISFNPAHFGNLKILVNLCEEQSKIGHWVVNSSPASIGAHEAGHGVEWILIQNNSSYTYDFERMLAWRDCVEAKSIVSQAVKNVKMTSYGKKKRKEELIRGISGYAVKDESETMAEAFADVYANGDKCNPLSVEIKRLVKEKLNQYKEG